MTFVARVRKWYMKNNPEMSYKEADRHAQADYEFWREIFTGSKA